MVEPVHDPAYWKQRLKAAEARNELHQSIFKVGLEDWRKIGQRQREILGQILGTDEASTWSVLDIGCGYGRFLDLVPKSWKGDYLGIDLSPDLLAKAKQLHPKHRSSFARVDVLDLTSYLVRVGGDEFDLAVAISFKPMIIRNMGEDIWKRMETQITCWSKRTLWLEYDATATLETVEFKTKPT